MNARFIAVRHVAILGWAVAVFLILEASAARLRGEALIDATFGTGGMPLPQEWERESGLSPSALTEEPEDEEDEEFSFVRVEKNDSPRESPALYREISQHDEDSFFEAAITARATGGPAEIRVGIRTRIRPHTYLASTIIRLDEEWSTQTLNFPSVPPPTERIELALEFYGDSAADIASFYLGRRSRSDVAGDLLLKAARAPARNLLRITRFPLGLQAGMAIDPHLCDLSEISITSDPKQKGPSGAPGLRIESEKTFNLYFPPFSPILKFDPHRVAISVRGKGEGRLLVVTETWTVTEIPFQANPNRWSRVETTFQPSETAKFHALRITGRGTFWIDALQVSHGARETPYESQGVAEVVFALPAGDASSGGIQFLDETAKIEYAVTGKMAHHVLRGRVHNLYGDQKNLPDIPLTADFLQTGSWEYDLFEDRPLGAFRIEAWIEDRRGNVVSPYYETVVHRLQRPRSWGEDSPSSFFGIHTHSARRHLVMAKALGFNWVRLHEVGLPFMGWHYLEPAPGKWTFFDPPIQRYLDHHLQILGTLSTTPSWASRLTQFRDAQYDRFYQPTDWSAFANYARTVAEHYRESIHHYEIWNGAWSPGHWSVGWSDEDLPNGYVTSENPGNDFARLTEKTHEAVKAIDPEMRILGLDATTSNHATGWIHSVVAAGGADATDVISYQQHVRETVGYAGDAVEAGYAEALAPIPDPPDESEAPPVWLTAGSAFRHLLRNGLYLHTLPWEEQEETTRIADGQARFALSVLAQGVEKMFFHSMHDHRFFGSGHESRSLVTEEGALHPSGAALSALAWHVDDAAFIERIDVRDGVSAYLFERGETSVAVLARRPGNDAEYQLPASEAFEFRDYLNNPVPPGSGLEETLVYARFQGPADELREALDARN